MKASGRKLLPVIVVPHGGPHSCTPTSFIGSSAFLSLHLSAAILSVNFRFVFMHKILDIVINNYSFVVFLLEVPLASDRTRLNLCQEMLVRTMCGTSLPLCKRSPKI